VWNNERGRSQRRVLAAVGFLWLSGGSGVTFAAAAEPAKRINVFLFTENEAGGFIDADAQERGDALNAMREQIQKKAKDRVTLVSSRAEADVTVEVLSRTRLDSGQEAMRSSRWPYVGEVVRAKLTAGDYSTEIVGQNDGRVLHTWRTAARDAAAGVDRWIAANRDRVLSLRSHRQ
jgi:hypothetical protein